MRTIGAETVYNITTRDHNNLCKIETLTKYYLINAWNSCGTDCTRSASLARGACAPKRRLSLPPNGSHLEILQRGDAARLRPQTTTDRAAPTSSTSKPCYPLCLPRSRITRRTVLSNRRSIWKQSRRRASGTIARRRRGLRRRRRCRPTTCHRLHHSRPSPASSL